MTEHEAAIELYRPSNTSVQAADHLEPKDVVHQVALIQQVVQSVMKENEHYGVIPGTSGKPSLLKPGAEKLSLTFRLAPRYEVKRYDLSNGHREYEVRCDLYHITTGQFFGSGVGSCSTMEGKYRYRSEDTGRSVPQAYWESRDPALLGGSQFTAKKKGGKWCVMQRVEHDNPADYYNTALKMGKKRAHVDAILTATAASDIFTQDLEDMKEVLGADEAQETGAESRPANGSAKNQSAAQKPKESTPGVISEAQRKRLYAISKKAGFTDDGLRTLCEDHGFKRGEEITRAKYDMICQIAADPEAAKHYNAPPDALSEQAGFDFNADDELPF